MVRLRDDGWAKARAGMTTVEEILRVTQEESPGHRADGRLRLSRGRPAGPEDRRRHGAPDARMVIERLQRDAYFPMEVTSGSGAWPGETRLADTRAGPGQGAGTGGLDAAVAMLLEAGLPIDRARHPGGAGDEPTHQGIPGDVLRSVRGGASFERRAGHTPPTPLLRLCITWCGPVKGRRAGGHPQAARRVSDGCAGVPGRARVALIYPEACSPSSAAPL